MIIAPIRMPKQQSQVEESLMLSGIKFKKEIASITPAAKASILYINKLEGFLITPINEPMIGARKLIIRMT